MAKTELATKSEAQVIPASESAQVLEIISRASTDPNTDIDKLERLMAMHERLTSKQAENAFNQAMTDAQMAMKPISANATNPQTRSKYATYAALDADLRPIYTEHGFALSFDTAEPPAAETVRVVCLVSHIAGHSRKYQADLPADGKGAKGGDVMTKTHAAGSAMSYGMRYLLKMIFNVAVGEVDDDGNAAGNRNIAEEVLEYNALVRQLFPMIAQVKKYLEPIYGEYEDAYNATAAQEAFADFDVEDQMALWKAPTKGGIFTTLERKLLKQPERAEAENGVKYI